MGLDYATYKALQNAQILHPFDPESDSVIKTDTCQFGIRAVLFNKVNGPLHTVSCISATLSQAEQRYAQFEREALAVVVAVKRFYKFVYGSQFTILTDSLSVKLLFDGKDISNMASPRLQRWDLTSDFKIEYTKKVEVADFLSRLHLNVETGDSRISEDYVAITELPPILGCQVEENTV